MHDVTKIKFKLKRKSIIQNVTKNE